MSTRTAILEAAFATASQAAGTTAVPVWKRDDLTPAARTIAKVAAGDLDVDALEVRMFAPGLAKLLAEAA